MIRTSRPAWTTSTGSQLHIFTLIIDVDFVTILTVMVIIIIILLPYFFDLCIVVSDKIFYFFLFFICVTVSVCSRNSRRSIKLDGKGENKGSKKWKPQSLKYTAARLHEKGVILEIEGLQTNQ